MNQTDKKPKVRHLSVPFRRRLALARALAEIAGIDPDQVDIKRAMRKLKQGWREMVPVSDLPLPEPGTAARLAFAEALDTEANDGLVRNANIRLLAEIEGVVGKAALLNVNIHMRPEQALPDAELDHLIEAARNAPALPAHPEDEAIDITPIEQPEPVPIPVRERLSKDGD